MTRDERLAGINPAAYDDPRDCITSWTDKIWATCGTTTRPA